MTGYSKPAVPVRSTVLVAMSLAMFASASAQVGAAPDSSREPTPTAAVEASPKPKPGAPQLVSFPTSDGGLIYGDLYGTGDHGVILAPAARFGKESWKVQAPVLARAGYRVLAIDFRGRGKSRSGPNAKRGERRKHLDVLGAARYLRKNGAKTISIIGSDFGATVAARAALEADPNEIDRLVLLAPAQIDRPEGIKIRKLFIVSRDDRIVPHSNVRELYDRCKQPKQLIIIDGQAHAHHIFGSQRRQRLMDEILRYLGTP